MLKLFNFDILGFWYIFFRNMEDINHEQRMEDFFFRRKFLNSEIVNHFSGTLKGKLIKTSGIRL